LNPLNLHPRLEADTSPVCATSSAQIRLMNDCRWPWIILVPVQADIEELHDLTHSQRESFISDVNQVSRVVQICTGCQSVNIAMLGNVVSQLHCHVIARNPGDPNWPNPVWGFNSVVPYDESEHKIQMLINAIQKSFS
jgi:diadenosine tetraphosphate (Ap4A) HIT family hydrolase